MNNINPRPSLLFSLSFSAITDDVEKINHKFRQILQQPNPNNLVNSMRLPA